MKPFKAVIFDLDGTIGNTLPLCIGAFRRAIEPFVGRLLSDHEIISTFGPSEEGTAMALAPDNYEQALDSYIEHYTAMHDMCPEPFAGMMDILVRLKEQGVAVALVTGKGARSCAVTLARYGLEDYFDIVETGSPTGNVKAEKIASVLERTGVKPEEALYVGDAPSDVTSSHQAGVAIAAAAWADTAFPEEILPLEPDYFFSSIEEFGRWLLD